MSLSQVLSNAHDRAPQHRLLDVIKSNFAILDGLRGFKRQGPAVIIRTRLVLPSALKECWRLIAATRGAPSIEFDGAAAVGVSQCRQALG
jgi:hypothetical protein